ncbi:hypothetical protein thsrh120_62660 [Rhizobium sp. No.120]
MPAGGGKSRYEGALQTTRADRQVFGKRQNMRKDQYDGAKRLQSSALFGLDPAANHVIKIKLRMLFEI